MKKIRTINTVKDNRGLPSQNPRPLEDYCLGTENRTVSRTVWTGFKRQ